MANEGDNNSDFPAPNPTPNFLDDERPEHLDTRRFRTVSLCDRITDQPTLEGVIDVFCRERGHGWIIPNYDRDQRLFLHISDIDEDWIPQSGDCVTFKKLLMPPRNERFQAVCVHFKSVNNGANRKSWADE